MKNIFVLLLSLIEISVFAQQTVTVQCNNSAESCFNYDPSEVGQEFLVTYKAVTANEPQNDEKSYSWTSSATFAPTGAVDQSTLTGKWENLPNSFSHWVQIIVTFHLYKKGTKIDTTGYPRIANSTQIKVTIKHLDKITSATVQNGNPSTIQLSGTKVDLPCSTAPFTISVPTPFTNPNVGVTYTWDLPVGWGGNSTSNTISISPAAAGNGIVKVTAKRTDGRFKQTFSVDLSRDNSQVGDPTINFTYGSPITCAGHTRLMTGAAASATSFVWSPISTGIIFTPNAATGMIKFNSTTTLTLTVDNGCGQPKTVSKVIIVGAPIFSEATVNGAPQQTPNYIQNPAFLSVNSDELTATFKYEIAAYNGSITQIPWSPGGKSVYAYAYPFVQIQANTTNICGTNSTMFFLYKVTSFYRMASPNPTQNTISVEMEKELGQQALVSVKLISHGRNSVERTFSDVDARRTNHFERSNKIDFDVSNLPRGTYYLLIDFKGEKKFKETIILN